MNRAELRKVISVMCISDQSCEAAIDSLLSTFTITFKIKKKSLEERKEAFRVKLLTVDVDYADLLDEFFDYWTEHNEGGSKMRFEMSKNQPFNIKRRLVTWKKNQKTFNNGKPARKTDEQGIKDWINSESY